MTINEAKEFLKNLQAKMSAYSHALGLLSYDGATTAPKKTAENRAHTLSILSEENYKFSTSLEVIETLEFLETNHDQLTFEENRQVELLLKDIKQMRLVPIDEYVEYQRLLVEADDVWHIAKETNDFKLFEPILEKIFQTNIRFAGYFDKSKKPYDFWLNEYEEGLNMEVCDEFFAKIRNRLVPLISKIKASKQVDDSFLKGDYSDDAQKELSFYLMKLIGLDLNHVGLATTEHPFTTSLGSHFDERITTHFYKNDFTSSMYSVIHEGGHALYDTGCDSRLAYTVLDEGVSMGIHESQSRFYENILGRSEEFINYVFPKIKELFPNLKNVDANSFFKAINKVEPSLIRTEADEVTYCLHVMVRYELEKKVMSGELKVSQLPCEWNRLYKEYLGVDVPDDSHGVLQDSHWSGGAIGYFPSYAFGSAYGAQLLSLMKQEVDAFGDLLKGDFSKINEWNKNHIWQYGKLYSPKKLLDRVFKKPFNADYYLDYLEEKISKIYNI